MNMTKNSESDHPVSNDSVGRFMVAVGAIVEHEETETILLIKRAGADYASGAWEVGYGRLDQGENPEAGLKREFKEETGLDIKPKKLLNTWFFNRGDKEAAENEVIGLTYWATASSQKVKLSSEHSEYQWLSPEAALELAEPKLIANEIRAFIEAKAAAKEAQAADQARQRALADYHNLVRRTQAERGEYTKLAASQLIEDLIEPLEHLSMAAEQLDDEGLTMVVSRLWTVLHSHGLEEVEALGREFAVETMEAVDKENGGDVVIKVLRRGYILNGKVIQHAKVVLGADN